MPNELELESAGSASNPQPAPPVEALAGRAASEAKAATPAATAPASVAAQTAPTAAPTKVRLPPVGVTVGVRQVIVNGSLVAMPEPDQIRLPWMDLPPNPPDVE